MVAEERQMTKSLQGRKLENGRGNSESIALVPDRKEPWCRQTADGRGMGANETDSGAWCLQTLVPVKLMGLDGGM